MGKIQVFVMAQFGNFVTGFFWGVGFLAAVTFYHFAFHRGLLGP